MGVKAVLDWISDHAPFVPSLPDPTTEDEAVERQRITDRADTAIERADRVVDTWNEQIRRSWDTRGDE